MTTDPSLLNNPKSEADAESVAALEIGRAHV